MQPTCTGIYTILFIQSHFHTWCWKLNILIHAAVNPVSGLELPQILWWVGSQGLIPLWIKKDGGYLKTSFLCTAWLKSQVLFAERNAASKNKSVKYTHQIWKHNTKGSLCSDESEITTMASKHGNEETKILCNFACPVSGPSVLGSLQTFWSPEIAFYGSLPQTLQPAIEAAKNLARTTTWAFSAEKQGIFSRKNKGFSAYIIFWHKFKQACKHHQLHLQLTNTLHLFPVFCHKKKATAVLAIATATAHETVPCDLLDAAH